MPYEPHPDDTVPEPGGYLVEAAKRLARRPGQRASLERFVDMWGLDGYDPFDDVECSETVRQVITLLLLDSQHFAKSK